MKKILKTRLNESNKVSNEVYYGPVQGKNRRRKIERADGEISMEGE